MSIVRDLNPHVTKIPEPVVRRPSRSAWVAWAMLIATAWACAATVTIATLQLIMPQVREAIETGGREFNDLLAQQGITALPERFDLVLAIIATWCVMWTLAALLTVMFKPGARAASTVFAAGTGLTVGMAALPIGLVAVAVIA